MVKKGRKGLRGVIRMLQRGYMLCLYFRRSYYYLCWPWEVALGAPQPSLIRSKLVSASASSTGVAQHRCILMKISSVKSPCNWTPKLDELIKYGTITGISVLRIHTNVKEVASAELGICLVRFQVVIPFEQEHCRHEFTNAKCRGKLHCVHFYSKMN